MRNAVLFGLLLVPVFLIGCDTTQTAWEQTQDWLGSEDETENSED